LRRGLVAVSVVIVASVSGCGSGTHRPSTAMGATSRTSRSAKPKLVLTAHQGRPGTVIGVEGFHCPHPVGQPDQLSWFNKDANAAVGRYRRVKPLHRRGDTVRARFKILQTDPPGRGLLDLLCGGGRGNAIGHVTVER
jgi:hypothetical protein